MIPIDGYPGLSGLIRMLPCPEREALRPPEQWRWPAFADDYERYISQLDYLDLKTLIGGDAGMRECLLWGNAPAVHTHKFIHRVVAGDLHHRFYRELPDENEKVQVRRADADHPRIPGEKPGRITL